MNKKVRHFTDLNVWRKAHGLFLSLLEDVDGQALRPSGQMLLDQLLRSTGSVCANIAEGFNRSQKRYVNSLDIALGEANECENWLYKARDAGLLAPDAAKERLGTVIEIEKMLASLKSKIAAKEPRATEESEDYTLEEREWPSETGGS